MALERLLGHQDEPHSVEDLRGRGLNFDPGQLDALARDGGGHEDDLRQSLAREPPGEPVPGGSWDVARRLIGDYAFADGSAVQADFDHAAPLEGRDMLLRASFYGLRFDMGVRGGAVRDETRVAHGRRARVWGWTYSTLDGHLERGRMDYEVWKWLDSGEVEFRITAVSTRADIRNPIVRAGVALFARREQLRFYHHALERMAQLTAAGAGPSRAGPV
ncbi:MAG: hypothetical protein QOH46_2666 [Solirubrobacteraceae bacterium]|jgi:uncharacterized protein (UPF0548 family)|nr:hypothetical protein [Solirubrobacteraceae bacterium]